MLPIGLSLLAVGAANLGSALLHGFPVSSSGSRTAIGEASGARSQVAGLVTVVVTLLSVWTLQPLLSAFPAASLAAVVVYAAVRLVLPFAPDWVLRGIGLISLVTAVYAAGMATIQTDTRRMYAQLFLSHASLVLVGLELGTEISLTASLCLWFSVILSLGGFGLTLRAMEARFGRLSIRDHHGLYEHTPAIAGCCKVPAGRSSSAVFSPVAGSTCTIRPWLPAISSRPPPSTGAPQAIGSRRFSGFA